jgi:hypothetical protein
MEKYQQTIAASSAGGFLDLCNCSVMTMMLFLLFMSDLQCKNAIIKLKLGEATSNIINH